MAPSLDSLLARPSHVYVAGSQPLAERPLGPRFRALVTGGALSALLLLQATQGAQANERLVEATAPIAQATAAEPVRFAQPELVNPVALRDHSGVVASNGMDGMKLLEQWVEGGVTPGQLRELTEVLVVTQSPVVVRDAQTKADVLALAERTAGVFEVRTRIQAAEFLKDHSLGMLEADGVVGQGTAFVNVQAERSHDIQDTADYWMNITALRQGGPTADIYLATTQTPAQLNHAIDALKEAVVDTGLNSLRVPLPMWTSAGHLESVAQELTQANADLQRATGLDGAVLGLKGHLNLMVGIPYDVAITNMPVAGQVHMQTPMDALAHEWLHGVDAMLAYQVGYAPNGGEGLALMSEAIEHNHGSDHVGQQWNALKNGVAKALPQWGHQLDAYGKEHPELGVYLGSTRERLAYSFQAALADTVGQGSVLYAKGVEEKDTLLPKGAEVKQSQATWQQTFQSLQTSWWQGLKDPNEPKTLPTVVKGLETPGLNTWRTARNNIPASKPGPSPRFESPSM